MSGKIKEESAIKEEKLVREEDLVKIKTIKRKIFDGLNPLSERYVKDAKIVGIHGSFIILLHKTHYYKIWIEVYIRQVHTEDLNQEGGSTAYFVELINQYNMGVPQIFVT
jgi:hypothetical protein